jgi:hypothetical protein
MQTEHQDLKHRLLSHVDQSGPSYIEGGVDRGPCWLWTGRLTDKGYGQVKHRGKACRAHRVAWREWKNGRLGSRVLLHICDTPRCINPDHLRVGTQLHNVHDMIRKGRAVFFGKKKVA